MKLFFINWSGKDLGLVAAAKALQQEHRVLYWTAVNIGKEVHPADFPDAVLHEHAEALLGKPAEALAGADFPPPGEALLAKLYETESIVLTMMNKHFEKRTVSERKHLYLNYVQYWDGVLEKYRPDAVIFPTIPHTSYDFVVYSLAKIRGIRTVMMEPTWVGDRMVIMTDYKAGSEDFRLMGKAPLSRGSLSEDIKQEYEHQTRKGGNRYVQHIKKRFSGISALKIKARSFWTTITVLKDPSVFLQIATYIPRRFRANQRTEYQRLVTAPDLGAPFVYFPLHYQPERNSSPQGGVFVDQILMAKTLSAALPEGWLLYVKEHPTQWLYRGLDFFSYRFRGYYQALAELHNVRIVPLETPSAVLLTHAKSVATITGTAGWEALLNRKPVLVFGYPWYRQCPGVFSVHDMYSCRNAFKGIASGYAPTEGELFAYLHSLDVASFHGYIDADGQKVSLLTAEENAVGVARQISLVLAADTVR